jgi:hypothetical protein
MYSLRKALQTSLLVFFIFCFSTLTARAKYGGGSGTAADPYLIKTAEQMNTIGANPADWDKYFKLIEDIDLSDFTGTTFNIIGQWVEWGSLNNQPFAGVFDGNGKTISNFSYSSASRNGIGIFAYVKGRIQNLQLVNPKIVANGLNVGSLAGYLEEGRIVHCYVRNADISGGMYVGGLVGTSDGLISSCSTSGRVFGDVFVGGLVGLLGQDLVTNCYSTTAVSGNQNVGGLVGITDHEFSTISDSYATGAVSGNVYVGGLTGLLSRGAAAKCYSAGKVSGVQHVGGLIGYIGVLATVWNCFWDVEASGQPTSADGIGKTTTEMQTINTFSNSGWDFYNTWTICEGMNYPVLLWQIPVGDFRCPDGVDMIDFAWFAQQWRQNNCGPVNYFCDGMDLDQSGSVDFYDLALFADHWLEGIPQ